MPEPVLFDPAIEVLLREIAADPDSCLLRVPRPSVVKSLAHRQGIVRSSATGLSSAERELLRVHRAELAKLLREACVMRLAQHPDARIELTLHLTATRETPVLTAAAWRAKAKCKLEDTQRDAISVRGVELIDSCVAPGGIESASVAQLALASMRLEPTDSARIYPAIEFILEGREELALRVLQEVLAGFCARLSAAYAWTNIGLVHAKRGEVVESNRAYANAVRADGSLLMPSFSLLGSACQFGSGAEIAAAGRYLDARITEDCCALKDYVLAIREWRSRGFGLSVDRIPVLQEVKNQVGPTARMVIDALL